MNWRLIWRGLKHADMRKKVFAVLGILVVYRMLAHVPIPLAEPTELKQILENIINSDGVPQLLSFINLLSGGALASLSIMLVGLGPYINASIAIQVLTKAIPKLETLQKEGEFGRKKISQYTRILTLPLALIQSVAAIYLVRQLADQFGGLGDITANASIGQWALMIAALTAGAMILMWLGELITEKGLGNGISLLITVGIVSQLPFIISSLYSAVVDSTANLSLFGWFELPINSSALIYSLILLVSTLLVTVFVVYLNEAFRPLRVSYAKKVQGARAYGDVSTILPVKLIVAGVIPIIFAIAFLSAFQLAGQVMSGLSNQTLAAIGDNLLLWFTSPGSVPGEVFVGLHSYIYPVAYFLLVVAFTYVYTGFVFNSKTLAENLQRQGGFIADIRPGQLTEKYLSRVVNRLNLFGSISLGFLALTPIIAQAFLGTSQLALGGTSILILVAVALETLRKVESNALMVTYEDSQESLTDQPKRPSPNWFKKLFADKE